MNEKPQGAKGEEEVEHVGVIFLQIANDGQQKEYIEVSPTMVGNREMEKRDVFCSLKSLEKPFYLTHTGNKVLVVDPSRIEYFEGKDPKSKLEARLLKEEQERLERERLEALKKEEERRQAELALGRPLDDVKIGTIVVQYALKPGQLVSSDKEVLDVFCRPARHQDGELVEEGKPYMITKTGKKIEVQNRSDIRILQTQKKPDESDSS